MCPEHDDKRADNDHLELTPEELERRKESRRSSGVEDQNYERRLRLDRRKDSDEPLAAAKASLLYRFLARLIDTLFFALLCSIFYPVGILAGFIYILIADGFMEGRSIGKRIIGLRVVLVNGRDIASFKESILRNISVALVLLFAVIPIIGWLLLITLGILVIAFELYLAATDAGGQRAGDILAGTVVIQPSKSPVKIEFEDKSLKIAQATAASEDEQNEDNSDTEDIQSKDKQV